MRDADLDRLADEVRALPAREKLAMARELLDAPAKMRAADDVEAGR